MNFKGYVKDLLKRNMNSLWPNYTLLTMIAIMAVKNIYDYWGSSAEILFDVTFPWVCAFAFLSAETASSKMLKTYREITENLIEDNKKICDHVIAAHKKLQAYQEYIEELEKNQRISGLI